jgi:hypothetical protein
MTEIAITATMITLTQAECAHIRWT